MKPFYRDNANGITIYNADCLDLLPQLKGRKIDAVVTDPPYGVNLGARGVGGSGGAHGLGKPEYEGYTDTYENFVSEIVPRINASLDIAKRGAVFTGPHIHEQRKPDAIGGVYSSAAAGRHRWGFKNLLPVLLYGTYPNLHLGARVPTVLSSNDRCERNGHPCPKPLSWIAWLVRLVSLEGETIIDPFMGSGTTLLAARQLGRKAIGIEISEKYCQIAVERLKAPAKVAVPA